MGLEGLKEGGSPKATTHTKCMSGQVAGHRIKDHTHCCRSNRDGGWSTKELFGYNNIICS